ncbi:SDR family NAD(P)-dependent oxidoreductase [Pontibacter anaerobius]|uniref:SDR family NAD(P)-dependent oxidoreductase n=1 Tax=Pontibacter anaerobius TaxID=2993940 RepID=A0ABT3RGR4_9BACT|nr:SDR family NAD(P)-dependent oxidoreductase [Pontibacter anaerobius]MCX2740824.1 SDR family NAD(P)-dependent oxidoreductase [Pontibacter anaerobius]
MARVFITGSAEGLGQLAAKALIAQGHRVVLHARNAARARDAMDKNPGAEAVVTGDLSNREETIQLASDVNALGAFDAVIHNAGVYQAPAKQIFAVNTLAPYILTCLIQKPKRLIYLTSGMHLQGQLQPESLTSDSSRITYSDSKLHVLTLCMAVARKWAEVYANAVNPGWVPTKMGGRGAPDSLQKGYETQVWLAVNDDEKATVSGRYFFHQQERHHHPDADNVGLQEQFLEVCKKLTGVAFPQ